MLRNQFSFVLGLSLLFTACNLPVTPNPTPTPTATISPTDTPVPQPTQIPTDTLIPDPYGCLKPPDDYTRVEVNQHLLNQRTYAMLLQAETIYQGRIEVTGFHLVQGSYTGGVAASFGTHLGGGAVDIGVIAKEKFEILEDDIPLLLDALRRAGFAAWLRELDELYSGSPIHIHAIAIGDVELSDAAEAQLIGEYGYFRGYNGLPPEWGGPTLDIYGGPLICSWMREMGYGDWSE